MVFQPHGQITNRVVTGRVRILEVDMPKHSLSWREDHRATAYMLFTSHDTAKWLTVQTTEIPARGLKRTTIAALDEGSARALFEQLGEVFK